MQGGLFSRKLEFAGLIIVLVIFIMLFLRYYEGASLGQNAKYYGRGIAEAVDNYFGTCPENQIRINLTDGYLCREESNPSLWLRIYDTYPLHGDGREVIYRFLDQGNISMADLYLKDLYPVNRYDPVEVGSEIDWGMDPYNETYWRFIFYSLRPQRHLLYAGRETGNNQYNDKLIEIVESFLDYGMVESSSWEDYHAVSFRTMMLTNIWWKLREEKALSLKLSNKMLDALEAHGEFLMDEEHFQSSYNHAINQAAALLVLSNSFPDMPNSEKMMITAKSRLENTLDEIIDENGVLVENSPFYHFYVLQKCWQIRKYAQKNNINLSQNFDKKIDDMIYYSTFVLQPNLETPLLGASLYRKINLFGEFEEMAYDYPELYYVLSKGEYGEIPGKLNSYYNSSGQIIMRSGWGTERAFENETHIVFDFGPYRTPHSHLDALNFNLFSNNITFIGDSGLYTYEDGEYKDYFHGTKAHNTVMIDNKNQPPGTAFLDEYYHDDGYAYAIARSHLYPGVVHIRSIILMGHDTILIIDHLVSDKEHQYNQLFHLSPMAKVYTNGTTVAADYEEDGKTIKITQILNDNITLEQVTGDENTPHGICSFTYENAVPCPMLSYESYGKNSTYITLIEIGKGIANASITSMIDLNYLEIETNEGKFKINISLPAQSETNTSISDTKIITKLYDLNVSGDDFHETEYEFENGIFSVYMNPEGKMAFEYKDYSGDVPTLQTKIDGIDDYVSFNNIINTEIPLNGVSNFIIFEQEDFLPIFGYHNIIPDDKPITSPTLEIHSSDFEKQVEYATNEMGCRWYTLGDLIENYILKEKKIPKNACVMTFDDGRENNYENVFPILKKYGIVATFYIILDHVEKTSYMSWMQIMDLYQNGNEIGSHSISHGHLVNISTSELINEINESKNILEYMGFDIKTFAYPRGESNENIIEILKDSGFMAARDISKNNTWRERRPSICDMKDDFIWHMYYYKPELETPEELEKAVGYNTWWQFEEMPFLDLVGGDEVLTKINLPTPTSYVLIQLKNSGDSISNKFIVSRQDNYIIDIYAVTGNMSYGNPYSDLDKYNVYVDNILKKKMQGFESDCVNISNEYFCHFFVNASLSEGPHILKIMANNGPIKLDKFRVFRNLTVQDTYKIEIFSINETQRDLNSYYSSFEKMGINISYGEKSDQKGLIENLSFFIGNGLILLINILTWKNITIALAAVYLLAMTVYHVMR